MSGKSLLILTNSSMRGLSNQTTLLIIHQMLYTFQTLKVMKKLPRSLTVMLTSWTMRMKLNLFYRFLSESLLNMPGLKLSRSGKRRNLTGIRDNGCRLKRPN
jgi:hypothetical protein